MKTLEQLEQEHKGLYEKFLPTLSEYQTMAARCLELQIEIFRLRLRKEFSSAGVIPKRELVISVTARDNPKVLDQIVAKIRENKIDITAVVYDPRTFTFHLFSEPRT